MHQFSARHSEGASSSGILSNGERKNVLHLWDAQKQHEQSLMQRVAKSRYQPFSQVERVGQAMRMRALTQENQPLLTNVSPIKLAYAPTKNISKPKTHNVSMMQMPKGTAVSRQLLKQSFRNTFFNKNVPYDAAVPSESFLPPAASSYSSIRKDDENRHLLAQRNALLQKKRLLLRRRSDMLEAQQFVNTLPLPRIDVQPPLHEQSYVSRYRLSLEMHTPTQQLLSQPTKEVVDNSLISESNSILDGEAKSKLQINHYQKNPSVNTLVPKVTPNHSTIKHQLSKTAQIEQTDLQFTNYQSRETSPRIQQQKQLYCPTVRKLSTHTLTEELNYERKNSNYLKQNSVKNHRKETSMEEKKSIFSQSARSSSPSIVLQKSELDKSYYSTKYEFHNEASQHFQATKTVLRRLSAKKNKRNQSQIIASFEQYLNNKISSEIALDQSQDVGDDYRYLNYTTENIDCNDIIINSQKKLRHLHSLPQSKQLEQDSELNSKSLIQGDRYERKFDQLIGDQCQETYDILRLVSEDLASKQLEKSYRLNLLQSFKLYFKVVATAQENTLRELRLESHRHKSYQDLLIDEEQIIQRLNKKKKIQQRQTGKEKTPIPEELHDDYERQSSASVTALSQQQQEENSSLQKSVESDS